MTTIRTEPDEGFQLQDLKLEIDVEEHQFVCNRFQVTDGVIEVLQVKPGGITYEEVFDLSDEIPAKETTPRDEGLTRAYLPNINKKLPGRETKDTAAANKPKKRPIAAKPVQIHSSSKDNSLVAAEKNKCPLCSKYFQSQFHLRRHVQSIKHTPRDTYQYETNIQTPGAIAVTAKFVCPVCNKGFYSQHGLNAHVHRHSTTKSFQCHHCSSAFKVKSDMLKHMIVHFNLEPMCKCKTCGKSFKNPVRLRRHTATHNNVRNFSCAHCSSTHKRKSDLKSHLAVHFEGLKKYTCPVCSKKLLGSCDLKYHQQAGSCGRNKRRKRKKKVKK